MIQTIQGTIKQLHGSLRDYIEATYHISSPALIEQRKELLDRAGVIYQIPYIESTPRYQSGERFSAIKGLPSAALNAYTALSTLQVMFRRCFTTRHTNINRRLSAAPSLTRKTFWS